VGGAGEREQCLRGNVPPWQPPPQRLQCGDMWAAFKRLLMGMCLLLVCNPIPYIIASWQLWLLSVRASVVCFLFPLWFICRRTQIVFGGAGPYNSVPFEVTERPEAYLEDLMEKTNRASRESQVYLPPRRGIGGGTLTGPGGSLDYAGSSGEGKAVAPPSLGAAAGSWGPPAPAAAPKSSAAAAAAGGDGFQWSTWAASMTGGSATTGSGKPAAVEPSPGAQPDSVVDVGDLHGV
jgi:hypothetical protein